jgi:Cupin-like domain
LLISNTMTSLHNSGPEFTLIEETTWDALRARGFDRNALFNRPVLVKGGLAGWQAYQRWSFEHLAHYVQAGGSGGQTLSNTLTTKFTDGLVEQGITQGRPYLPVAPYLQTLAEDELVLANPEAALLPLSQRQSLSPGERFHLNWAYMQTFEANRMYLAQWDILSEFPALRNDFNLKDLWPGRRLTWEFIFLGPAHTVTGLHNDFPHNWFCQLRGVKEFILFPPDQSEHLCPSQKYDWGATLSDINIAQLHTPEQATERAKFAKAKGIYARVEAGDALFIPKRTWHAVVSHQPSISLGVFGLTAGEVVTGGALATVQDALHRMHLYRWGRCTCHKSAQSSRA